MDELFDRRYGAFLGTFVGDVLGVPFEGSKRPLEMTSLEVMEGAHFGFGGYSDDTEMAIAVLEELVAKGEIDADSMARRFASVATIPGGGYGTKTRKVLLAIREGFQREEALALYYPEGGSERNGASMRVAPLAANFYNDPELLKDQVTKSALATHTGLEAIDCANALAQAIASAIRQESKEEILRSAIESLELDVSKEAFEEIRKALSERWNPSEAARRLGTEIMALRSIPGAIYAALQGESFEDIFLFAINMGGDTDTQAAMAGAITGGRLGASSISRQWVDSLDDGDRGRGYAESLCLALWG
jgi:ADP-ribosylglycohydrolase